MDFCAKTSGRHPTSLSRPASLISNSIGSPLSGVEKTASLPHAISGTNLVYGLLNRSEGLCSKIRSGGDGGLPPEERRSYAPLKNFIGTFLDRPRVG